jgi:hypothetical protein
MLRLRVQGCRGDRECSRTDEPEHLQPCTHHQRTPIVRPPRTVAGVEPMQIMEVQPSPAQRYEGL